MSAAERFRPGSAWSLWDMITFKTNEFIFLAREIGRLSTHLHTLPAADARTAEVKQNDKKALVNWKAKFDILGLKMCSLQCDRVIGECGDTDYLTHSTMITLIDELGNRMQDECSLRHFLHIPDAEYKYFEPSEPLFGSDVENKIPSISEDIAEAGKCLGLSRTTAAVFHLMRVMEVGVQQFGNKLGISATDEKVWQVILDGINSEIKKLGKDPKTKTFAAISSHLYNVKLTWRNETMHPKATYTLEEAEGTFNAVRSFMKQLVTIL